MEHAKSLLAELRKCHKEVNVTKEHIHDCLKKLKDGWQTLSEQDRCECIRIFQDRLSPSCRTLTELIDDGPKLLELQEHATSETDGNVLGAELRKENCRCKHPDSGLGLSRGSSIYDSTVPSGSDFDTRSPVEHQEEHDLNSPSCEDRFEFPSNEFLNLSLGSLESDNCNEQTVIDNQGAEVRFDQKTGAVPVAQPERDSIAFANGIPGADVYSINAQATAAQQSRIRNRNDASVIAMKDEESIEKESDV